MLFYHLNNLLAYATNRCYGEVCLPDPPVPADKGGLEKVPASKELSIQ